MRNPDSLNVSEPGRKENREQEYSKRLPSHLASGSRPPGPRLPASISELEIRAEHLKCRSLSQDELDYFRSRGVDALTLATPWPVLVDRVQFDGAGFFDFARDGDNGNAVPAFIIGVLGGGGLIDLCAWQLEVDRTALWLGAGFALGERQIDPPHFEPLSIWRSPLKWLRVGRRGIVVLRSELAWSHLADVPLLAESIEHGRKLRGLLVPRLKPAIFVRAKHGVAVDE